jgi:hypothetical protein
MHNNVHQNLYTVLVLPVERKRKDHLACPKENLTNTVPQNGLPAGMHGLIFS